MAIRTVLILTTALFLATFGAASADAHAVLLEQSVVDGARLATAPAAIRLRFNEIVTPVLVRVLDAKGDALTNSKAVSEVDRTVIIAMPPTLPSGNYVVTYRVISADSHPVGGSFVFAVGDAAPEPGLGDGNPSASHDASWLLIAAILQAIFYAALLFGAGGALFPVLVARGETMPRQDRNFILGAALVGTIAILVLIGVEGAMSADVPLTGIVDPDIWRIGLRTSVSANAGVSIMGFLVLTIGAMGWAGKFGPAALTTGGVLAIAGLTVTGHAAAAPPAWLAAPVLGLHALCAAFWVGALVPIHRLLSAANPMEAATPVSRFSRLALIAVGLLLIGGLTLAILQVKEPSALVTTDYGRRLLIKLLLVILLLGCAAFNKLRLTPRLARGDTRAALALRRMGEVELVLVIAIAGATAFLGQATPPRALQEQAAEHHDMDMAAPAFSVATFAKDRIAAIDVTPARVGKNTLEVTLLDSDGTLMTPVAVKVFLANPALGIEASEHGAVAVSRGRYSVPDANFPIAGTWTVEIEALVTDFEAANFSTEVPIQ